ncbi:protein PRRC2A-like, partial [Haliaeetus albicilla]|uniref:protein PRRC2A-like n=1 Tax=Haliaeetus albicilla TaxID=8969 RepID=UPI0037E76803
SDTPPHLPPPAPPRSAPPPRPPPDPIGTERSQRAEKTKAPPEEPGRGARTSAFSGGGPDTWVPPPTTTGVTGGPEAWAPPPESDSRRRGSAVGKNEKEALPTPATEGLDAAPRDWEVLPGGGPQPHGGPEAPLARPPEPKGLAPPGDPPGPSQRLYPELFYGGASAVGQVPSTPVESQLGTGSSFRPGTPSLNPYRPVFVAGAGLPPLPLKGPFVEFPAMGGPDLAKLGGAGGLLYPPAPPFLYSPPFCPDPPLLQVRQELTPPSDFYGQGQSSFQQMLLPVVESPVPPVVNFGGPPGPPAPPLPLLPLGRLVAPPRPPLRPPRGTPRGTGRARTPLGAPPSSRGAAAPGPPPPAAPPPPAGRPSPAAAGATTPARCLGPPQGAAPCPGPPRAAAPPASSVTPGGAPLFMWGGGVGGGRRCT